MPLLIEPDTPTHGTLRSQLPAGSHVVSSRARLLGWLDTHPGEYVAVVGPDLHADDAFELTEELRSGYPAVSVVLVRDDIDAELLARAFRAGARDVVPVHDSQALEQAVRRARELLEALRGPGATPNGRVINVFSPKGGVGKTTVAVNLATALNATDAHRVCLVDLDLAFGDVAITLQMFPENSIEQAVGSEDSLDAGLVEALLTRHDGGLFVLAAPTAPDVRERVTATLVSQVLQLLRGQFDFVVLDTAPALDEVMLAALDETDECVVVATLDVPTLKNVRVALETLDLLDVAREQRHLLLNRADDEVGLAQQKVEEVLGMPISARVGTATEIAAATNAGTPIVSSNPRHPSSIAFRQLAAELAPAVTSGADEGPEPGRGRRGLLRLRAGGAR